MKTTTIFSIEELHQLRVRDSHATDFHPALLQMNEDWKIRDLDIDIETYSSVDLGKCGVYRYAASPDFEILLFGYSINNGPVSVVDLAAGEEIPRPVRAALGDPSVTKWSFNVNFERVCLSSYFHFPEGLYFDPASWKCTRVWSSYAGLPQSLEGVGAVLGLEEQKLTAGRDLIRYFSCPCTPARLNGGRTRNLPEHDPDKWEAFKSYNVRDVEVELEIRKELSKFPVPGFVWEEFWLDQQINDRGIGVDMDLVSAAIEMDDRARADLTEQMRKLTGLENPNSVAQMKKWLIENGLETESLGKDSVARQIETAPPEMAEVLKLRRKSARTSVRKYTAMRSAVCGDGRARGMFQFYGAGRTGRFAGRIIQLQNLPRNNLPDLEQARSLVKSGDYEAVRLLYGDVTDTLSQLIRTAFVPKEGRRFIVADYSQIETRVLAWLAGETWRKEAFHKNEDIYCLSASRMFGVPVEKNGVNADLRKKGKVAELACIARGSLVLTDRGEIPIQHVTKKHRVWDGCRWVQHDGVVFRGFRPVCHYDGLSATEDHMVFVNCSSRPVEFGEAIRRNLPLRRKDRRWFSPDVYRGFAPTYDILNAGPNHRFTVSGCLVHNCGYGGSVGALKAMGAGEMGLSDEKLLEIVHAWREANPHIVALWNRADYAARSAIEKGCPFSLPGGIRFRCADSRLIVTLPSGRQLFYVNPGTGTNRLGLPCITYEGMNSAKKWGRQETYGAKLVENLTQAVSRDILTNAMRTLRPFDIVAHVHDELILEVPGIVSTEEICTLMEIAPDWADGLEIRAEGFEAEFYRKN